MTGDEDQDEDLRHLLRKIELASELEPVLFDRAAKPADRKKVAAVLRAMDWPEEPADDEDDQGAAGRREYCEFQLRLSTATPDTPAWDEAEAIGARVLARKDAWRRLSGLGPLARTS